LSGKRCVTSCTKSARSSCPLSTPNTYEKPTRRICLYRLMPPMREYSGTFTAEGSTP
jgi:hypothetical protein